jgi:hypothetical protein
MCSLGSPGFGCVVYRYVCATTSAASGVFGICCLAHRPIGKMSQGS